MTLILIELQDDNLMQEIKVQDNNTQVAAIRPHLYRHNFATGSLFIEVQDTNNRIIATSNTIAISAIGTLDFFHGYVRFDIEASLKANTVYDISLRSTGGYTFAESAYIGWVNDFDLAKYDKNYVPANSFKDALDMEIWERKVIERGENDEDS